MFQATDWVLEEQLEGHEQTDELILCYVRPPTQAASKPKNKKDSLIEISLTAS